VVTSDRLRLGIIGISEGNGHPYSWAAIFNGYDEQAMAGCPFPTIPDYLRARSWPADFLGDEGEVTHIWTQDPDRSQQIARASRITQIVEHPQEMVGQVDAVLLARDDAEHHLEFAEPFLRAGLPVYVDKPLALTVAQANHLLALEQQAGQLFSCSALRYAQELRPGEEQLRPLGDLRRIEGVAPKRWSRYAMHIVEPVVALLARAGLGAEVASRSVHESGQDGRRLELVLADGIELSFTTTGSRPSPIALRLLGSGGELPLTFSDSFSAFRGALEAFVRSIREASLPIPRSETLRAVEILSWGL
jgi:predicted dehydrogenase